MRKILWILRVSSRKIHIVLEAIADCTKQRTMYKEASLQAIQNLLFVPRVWILFKTVLLGKATFTVRTVVSRNLAFNFAGNTERRVVNSWKLLYFLENRA